LARLGNVGNSITDGHRPGTVPDSVKSKHQKRRQYQRS